MEVCVVLGIRYRIVADKLEDRVGFHQVTFEIRSGSKIMFCKSTNNLMLLFHFHFSPT